MEALRNITAEAIQQWRKQQKAPLVNKCPQYNLMAKQTIDRSLVFTAVSAVAISLVLAMDLLAMAMGSLMALAVFYG